MPAEHAVADARRAAIIIGFASLLRLLLAPVRVLSPDEAYYLAAARTGFRIPDHPPLLLWLLRVADRLPGPVELRVRALAVILAAVTAAGIVALARAIAEARKMPNDSSLAAGLACFGLMGFVSGVVTTPDAPFLAATAWLFAVATRKPRPLVLSPLAAIAVASKVAALLPVTAIALALARRGERRAAIATALGGLVMLPLAGPSLVSQAMHAVGRGALVSAPRIGPFAALLALLVGAFFLYSPPVLVRAWKERAALAAVPGGHATVLGIGVLVTLSALVSGRPPEPNWVAPAMLIAVALASLASVAGPMGRAGLALHVAPTAVAVALFLAPDASTTRIEVLARMPHQLPSHARELPPYARPAWDCTYEWQCGYFNEISRR